MAMVRRQERRPGIPKPPKPMRQPKKSPKPMRPSRKAETQSKNKRKMQRKPNIQLRAY